MASKSNRPVKSGAKEAIVSWNLKIPIPKIESSVVKTLLTVCVGAKLFLWRWTFVAKHYFSYLASTLIFGLISPHPGFIWINTCAKNVYLDLHPSNVWRHRELLICWHPDVQIILSQSAPKSTISIMIQLLRMGPLSFTYRQDVPIGK